MQWNSVSEFFAMGGYALYVWGSFGITGAIMVAEMLQIRQQRMQLLYDLRTEVREEGSAS